MKDGDDLHHSKRGSPLGSPGYWGFFCLPCAGNMLQCDGSTRMVEISSIESVVLRPEVRALGFLLSPTSYVRGTYSSVTTQRRTAMAPIRVSVVLHPGKSGVMGFRAGCKVQYEGQSRTDVELLLRR